jgi:hypothetical protein
MGARRAKLLGELDAALDVELARYIEHKESVRALYGSRESADVAGLPDTIGAVNAEHRRRVERIERRYARRIRWLGWSPL